MPVALCQSDDERAVVRNVYTNDDGSIAWALLAEANGSESVDGMTKNQKKKAKARLRAARNAALVAAGGVASQAGDDDELTSSSVSVGAPRVQMSDAALDAALAAIKAARVAARQDRIDAARKQRAQQQNVAAQQRRRLEQSELQRRVRAAFAPTKSRVCNLGRDSGSWRRNARIPTSTMRSWLVCSRAIGAMGACAVFGDKLTRTSDA